jgi:acyl carrier protein
LKGDGNMSMAEQELNCDAQEAALDNAADVQSFEAISAWLVEQVAEMIGAEPGQIDVKLPFSHYGLSSAEAVILAGDLSERLGRELPATLAWDHPTIEALSRHLAG